MGNSSHNQLRDLIESYMPLTYNDLRMVHDEIKQWLEDRKPYQSACESIYIGDENRDELWNQLLRFEFKTKQRIFFEIEWKDTKRAVNSLHLFGDIKCDWDHYGYSLEMLGEVIDRWKE